MGIVGHGYVFLFGLVLLGSTLFFSPFCDLGQIDFSTSEFAAAIAEEGITLAKDSLGFKRVFFA